MTLPLSVIYLPFWYASGDGCLTEAASEHLSLYRLVGQHCWDRLGATRQAECTYEKLNMYMARAAVAELRTRLRMRYHRSYDGSSYLVLKWHAISRRG